MAKMQAEDRFFQTNFNDFATRSYATYVLARPGADLQARTAEIPDLLREIGDPLFVNQEAKNVELVPLHEIYLRSTADTTGLFRGNSSTFIVILGVTTLLVLVFAMINYINLSVAQAEFRIKEAAVRRLLGQTREGLFAGFVLEALILCGVALLLGLGLAKLAEPVFRSILHTSVGLADGATAGNLVGLTVGWLVVGTVSGVVLATLGMVAMAAHYTRKRQHEVAIRKVFGSTTPQVLRLVLGAFLKWVGVAFVVAVPIILQLMGDWLEGYAYRVSLSWTLFFVAGAVTFLIAGSTVLWQSWRVARTNPVEVLRK